MAEHDQPAGLTLRSIILGLAMVLVVCLGAPYSIWMVGSSEITWSFFPIGVGVPFIVVLLANSAVRWVRPSWALRQTELVTAVLMSLVASGIPIFMVGLLLSIPSKPYYGATPENEWVDYIQPYLPGWAIPSNEREAMRWFYEGLPSGEIIPWDAWIGPLFWWLSLIFTFYFVCLCMVVILRRQWVEHERLIFPMTEVPRLLTEEEPGRALAPIIHRGSFWFGCAIPLGIILFNMISYVEPGFPRCPLLHVPIIGFMYLVGTSISFSIWFFYYVTQLENAVVQWAGLTVDPDTFVYSSQWGSSLSWQAFGAFMAMVLWSLWMGRGHLRAVFTHAFGGRRRLDDTGEMMSYRVAVFGFLGGSAYLIAWLCQSGMDLYVAALFLFGVYVVYLGITRVVIQSGLNYVTSPMAPQAMVLTLTGTMISPPNLVALALSYSWCSDIQSIFMPSAAHASKLSELYHRRRGLAVAISLAIVVGYLSTIYFVIVLCYEYGAGNFRSWFFAAGGGAGGVSFDAAVRQIRDPWTTDWTKLGLFGVGASVYSLLSFCHYRFFWWPLHPVGLAISTVWMLDVRAVIIAWLAKRVTLAIGGIEAYRRLRPFFIGLIIGFFAGIGISYAVDVIWYFGKGHVILHG